LSAVAPEIKNCSNLSRGPPSCPHAAAVVMEAVLASLVCDNVKKGRYGVVEIRVVERRIAQRVHFRVEALTASLPS
jgi:hypothetical protein